MRVNIFPSNMLHRSSCFEFACSSTVFCDFHPAHLCINACCCAALDDPNASCVDGTLWNPCVCDNQDGQFCVTEDFCESSGLNCSAEGNGRCFCLQYAVDAMKHL